MPNIQITDSHCHLDFHEFKIDLSSVIQRANTAGVTRMVTICTKLAQEPQVRAIAEKYPSVFYTAGVHPMNAADHPLVTVEELLILAKNKKFVGIGETGLDYFYTRESASGLRQWSRRKLPIIKKRYRINKSSVVLCKIAFRRL